MRFNGLKSLVRRQVRQVRRVFRNCSVGRPQDRRRLRVLEQILPQPVILNGADVREYGRSREGQVAVGIQAGRDAEGIRREITHEIIIAGHVVIIPEKS